MKEEPVDEKEDCSWNTIAKAEPSALQHSIKEDQELEPPVAVFVQPMVKQEGACIEETEVRLHVHLQDDVSMQGSIGW
ncbi:Protein of unknown function [Gryllus bimaculatus]|nr:Protein of unknown function [Gryllus bimaculatus]